MNGYESGREGSLEELREYVNASNLFTDEMEERLFDEIGSSKGTRLVEIYEMSRNRPEEAMELLEKLRDDISVY